MHASRDSKGVGSCGMHCLGLEWFAKDVPRECLKIKVSFRGVWAFQCLRCRES